MFSYCQIDVPALKSALDQRGASAVDLALDAGVSINTVYRSLKGGRISRVTARKIAASLQRMPEEEGLAAIMVRGTPAKPPAPTQEEHERAILGEWGL